MSDQPMSLGPLYDEGFADGQATSAARIASLEAEVVGLRETLHEIDIEAGNTIPPDGKDAGFAALGRIIRLINPHRLNRQALTEPRT